MNTAHGRYSVWESVSIWRSHIVSPRWASSQASFRNYCSVTTASPPMGSLGPDYTAGENAGVLNRG